MRVKTEYNKEVGETNYQLDFNTNCNLFNMTTEDNNNIILDEFHKSVEWLLMRGFDEYREIESNTINPAQQNIFIPLRVYRVFKNGHYKTFKLFARGLGGILITEA